MSRRNQSRRRRAYGRRQHEVRERRPGNDAALGWSDDTDGRHDLLGSDAGDDQRGFDAALGYGR